MQVPVLISCKSLKPEYERFKKINITPTSDFTIGRGVDNSVAIPTLSISKNHCKFKKTNKDEWFIQDYTSGITVNGDRIGKDEIKKLSHGDIISLEPSQEFVYRFIDHSEDSFEIPKKRIKLEENTTSDCDTISKESIIYEFEESQSNEIKNGEDKILNAKQNMQNTFKILKQQLQLDMDRKMQQLESYFAIQIVNMKGETNEVVQQKLLLLEEKYAQLAAIKQDMEGKIAELMERIKKHNETESELLNENNLLKKKLMNDREEFLAELSRKSSTKQDLLDKLESRIKDKEMELKELEEQKKLREQELIMELDDMKRNLEEQVQQTVQQRAKAEQQLKEQMEQLKKLSDEEKAKMELVIQEREEIQKMLTEAQINAEKSLNDQRMESEIEAQLAADRIQQQAEQSSEVISSLQQHLESVRNELQFVEADRKTLLESVCQSDPLAEVSRLMENELQCSICAELFVAATTLNCSHTFCKYCITMWQRDKYDCPICRARITSKCKSFVLDSFIEKMVQNLSEDMKIRRRELLTSREELESELARQHSARTNRNSTVITIDVSSDDDYEDDYESDDDY